MGELLSAAVQHEINEINYIKRKAPQQAAQKVAKDVPDLVEKSMNTWYGSYRPRVYQRTFGLHDGVISGTEVTIGQDTLTVNVNSDSVPDHKHDSGEYVFNGGFMQGIHGVSSIAVTTPPWEYYEKDIQDECDEKLAEVCDRMVRELL